MKKNKQDNLTFSLGTFDKENFVGHSMVTLHKKSQAYERANLILGKQGHIWLRVNYGKDKNSEMLYNDGVYKTLSDFKKALAMFIEQPLIDYVNQWRSE